MTEFEIAIVKTRIPIEVREKLAKVDEKMGIKKRASIEGKIEKK